jgi:threonine dehydrogenase-like Zn-dependent dehydrogenase
MSSNILCARRGGRLGATHDTLLPNKDPVREVMTITDGEGLGALGIAAGQPVLVGRGVEMARGHSRIVLVALLSTEPSTTLGHDIIRKEQQLVGNSMSMHSDVEPAISLVPSDSAGALCLTDAACHTR